MGNFEQIEHTADIKLGIKGGDIKDLFETAALGLFSLITKEDSIKAEEEFEFCISSDNIEELFIQWLRELFLKFSVDEYVLRGFQIQDLSNTMIKAVCKGERFDPSRHNIINEIKAVTYCDLRVEQVKDGTWQAEVVFDV